MTMPETDITAFYEIYRTGGLTPEIVTRFRTIILDYYETAGRRFPWRETDNPYHILVSEIMLQQTQTSRVEDKYRQFIAAFPGFRVLARVSLRDILATWQGMGYNRRAINLQRTASIVMKQYGGVLPGTPEELQRFPGIGANTAGAIAAIAFNFPAVFVETNIRAVYHAFFFRDQESITDKDLRGTITATLDTGEPRRWYYALYDYGAMLKRKKRALPNSSFRRQAPFKGSNRQLRGAALRALVSHPEITPDELAALLAEERMRLDTVLTDLAADGFITIDRETITLRERVSPDSPGES